MNFMCQTFKLKRPGTLPILIPGYGNRKHEANQTILCLLGSFAFSCARLPVQLSRHTQKIFRLEILMLFDENYFNDAKRCFSLGIFLLIYTMFTCIILVSPAWKLRVVKSRLNLQQGKSFPSLGAHTQDCVNSGKDRWENIFTNFLLQFSRMRMIMLKTLH